MADDKRGGGGHRPSPPQPPKPLNDGYGNKNQTSRTTSEQAPPSRPKK